MKCDKCSSALIERQLLISSYFECESCNIISERIEHIHSDEKTKPAMFICTCQTDQNGAWVLCDQCLSWMGAAL